MAFTNCNCSDATCEWVSSSELLASCPTLTNLFILSSLYEGLPNVLLEALALNKFVISSNCPTGPSEILDNNKGGLLFKISDHEDLAKKILFFRSNKFDCLKKIKHAKKRLHRFDYNKNLKKYFTFLKIELN